MKKMTPPNTMTPIRIIAAKGNSTLVEYVIDGLLARRYVPTAQINGNIAPAEILERGIPYGYPWEEMQLKFDSARFADEMRKAALWTPQDVLKNPQAVWSALRATFTVNFTTVLEQARIESKKGVKNA